MTVFADSWKWLASVLAFALAMSASPGPNNMMVAASGASWGFSRTIPHMLGVAAGFALMILAVALGAGAILRANPWLEGALRWVGAAYLLWLAIRIARASPATPGRAAGRPLGFLGAVAFQWVNPKAWVIAITGIVTYAGQDPEQASALAAVFLAVTLPCVAFWTAMGAGAGRLLHTPRALRTFNICLAVLLVFSLLSLLHEA